MCAGLSGYYIVFRRIGNILLGSHLNLEDTIPLVYTVLGKVWPIFKRSFEVIKLFIALCFKRVGEVKSRDQIMMGSGEQ